MMEIEQRAVAKCMDKFNLRKESRLDSGRLGSRTFLGLNDEERAMPCSALMSLKFTCATGTPTDF